MRSLLVVLAFASLVCIVSCGKSTTAPEPPKNVLTDNPMTTPLDSLVDRLMRGYAAKHTTAGFSLALIDGASTSLYDYGETRRGAGTLPDTNTVYEIGSITKTFTAATIRSWLSDNSIPLDAPVADYLPPAAAPGLEKNGVKATFKHVLNHTSGLPRIPADLGTQSGYRPDDPYRGYDSTRVFVYLASHELVRTPGTLPTVDSLAAFYSNLAYGVAGLLLERQSGIALQSVYANHLLTPLGMTATSLALPASNVAIPHDAAGRAVSFWDMAGLAGAGGLHSSLHDMAIYARAQLGLEGPALQPVFLECQAPTVTVDGRPRFGLAWAYLYLSDGYRLTMHDGATGGSTALIAFDRTMGRAVVFLSNNALQNGAPGAVVPLLEAFFAPRPLQGVPPAAVLSASRPTGPARSQAPSRGGRAARAAGP